MVRFVVFAVFALNGFFLVSSAPKENIINLFQTYNSWFEYCRRSSLEELNEIDDHDLPNIDSLKIECPEIEDFEREIKREIKTLYWFLKKKKGDLNALVGVLYLQNLALQYHNIFAKRVAYFGFKELNHETLTSEEEKILKPLRLIVEFLSVFATKKSYEKNLKAIMTARKGSSGGINLLNLSKEKLDEIDLDNKILSKIIEEDPIKFGDFGENAPSDVKTKGPEETVRDEIMPDTVLQMMEDFQEGKQQDFEKGREEEMRNMLNVFQKLLPGSTFPVLKSAFLSDEEFNKVLSNINGTDLLKPYSLIGGSRIVTLIWALLNSRYEIEGASTSTSEP